MYLNFLTKTNLNSQLQKQKSKYYKIKFIHIFNSKIINLIFLKKKIQHCKSKLQKYLI